MAGDAKTCDNLELARVLEQLPEGILVLDGDAFIQFANKVGTRLLKIKPKTAIGSSFPYAIEDGTMRDFDVEMTVKDVDWNGAPCRLIHLKSLKSSGAFHLEWKLEAALERAKEAEDALAELKEQVAAAPQLESSEQQSATAAAVSKVDYEERISELESLLELAEIRADEMQSDFARDDHQVATELQDALRHTRDAEEQVRQLEEDLAESRDRIRVAEEQAEVAEERAYALEAELEEFLAKQDDQSSAGDDLAEQFSALNVQNTERAEHIARLQEELLQATNKSIELQESLDRANSVVSESNEQALENERFTSGLKAEFDAAQIAKEAALVELEAAHLARDLALAELEAAQLARDSAQAELEEQRAELLEKLAQAESQENSATDRISLLEEELATLRGQLESGDLSSTQRVQELETQLSQSDERFKLVEKQLEDLREQAALASEESEELAEQMRLDSEAFEEKQADLNSRLEQMTADLDAAESARDSLLQELEDAAKFTEEQSIETADLQSRADKLEEVSAECEALRKDARRLEALLENAEELAEKGEKVEKLERKLEGALKRAEEAEERLVEERRLLSESKARADKLAGESRESQALSGEASNPETERMAFQDELTGLPNRNIIQRYLGFMLKQSARYDRLTAMLRVDCDNFKTISDTFGVQIGDELIRAVGECLSSVVRGSDVLGRYGEDEFIMLISELSDQDEASVITAAIIKRLYQKLRQPFKVGDQTITVGASIGVSLYPLDAVSGEEMFEHAGVALKRAKSTGRGQAQYFTPELQGAHDARNLLDSDLKRGLEQNQFELVYQPILDLSNGQIVGVESLIRWHHPKHGILSPEDFLQVAEDSGMIVLIGNWALRKAVEHAAAWHQNGLGIFVSVNLSRRQLLQADLLPTVQSVLAEMRCSPDRLLLEIPEELTGAQMPKVRETLVDLQRLGVRLAVDNFGQASTSLQDLRRGPFQVIKVDRAFVRGVPNDEENTGIVLSALTVGHHLGRVSIAVGVETEAEKMWLAKTGCRFAQGNFLSKPLLATQIAEFGKR